MKKIYTLLPRNLLKDYLNKHYRELDPADFVGICTRLNGVNVNQVLNNSTFLSSPVVLDYVFRTLPSDSEEVYSLLHSLREEDISDEMLDVIEKNIEKFPNVKILPTKCFTRRNICLTLLKNGSCYDYVIEKGLLSLDKLDDEIIEAIKVMPLSKELFVKFPILFSRKDIFQSSVMFDESILELPNDEFYLENFDVIEHHKSKIFKHKPSLIKHLSVAQLKTFIDYFPEDYEPTEEDLRNYPNLTLSEPLMRRAIIKNPRMIIYLDDIYVISDLLDIIDDIDVGKIITESDLEEHPNLIKVLNLVRNNPFPEYCMNLQYGFTGKKQIFEHLVDHKIDELVRLPFMREKFGAPLPEGWLQELLKKLDIETDYKDIRVSRKYFSTLYRVIYGVVQLRYNQAKESHMFLYDNPLSIKNDVIGVFRDFSEEKFMKLVLKIKSFDGVYSAEEVESHLRRLYELYKANGDIEEKDTTEFFTAILNHHQDTFFKQEQEKIKQFIILHSELTEKEMRHQINTYRIKKINERLKKGDYASLGTTEEELDQLLSKQDKVLRDIKVIRRSNLNFSDEVWNDKFRELHILFKNGQLDTAHVSELLGTEDTDVISAVIQNYEKIKFDFFKAISLDRFSPSIEHVQFDEKYIQVATDKRTAIVLTELVKHLDKEKLQRILANESSLEVVKTIIPLVGLIPEFSVEMLANLLMTFDRVLYKDPGLVESGKNEFTNFNLLIKYANGYASCDDVLRYALGKETSDILGASSREYFEYYMKMIQRAETLIPPVRVETDGYTFECGNTFDSERLLIGIRYSNSCIDLHNSAGVATYKGCLLDEDSDIIIARSKNGEFFTRLLIFRVGNVVQLYDISHQLPQDDLEKVAKAIIEQAKEKGDNIEFVVIPSYREETADFSDKRFVDRFPHADLNQNVTILASQGSEELDFDATPKARYDLLRTPINAHPTELELTKIRALRVEMEPDPVAREDLRREFAPFFSEDYDMVIAGMDWYVARKKDGTIESVCLPTERAEKEMQVALQEFGGDVKVAKHG